MMRWKNVLLSVFVLAVCGQSAYAWGNYSKPSVDFTYMHFFQQTKDMDIEIVTGNGEKTVIAQGALQSNAISGMEVEKKEHGWVVKIPTEQTYSIAVSGGEDTHRIHIGGELYPEKGIEGFILPKESKVSFALPKSLQLDRVTIDGAQGEPYAAWFVLGGARVGASGEIGEKPVFFSLLSRVSRWLSYLHHSKCRRNSNFSIPLDRLG